VPANNPENGVHGDSPESSTSRHRAKRVPNAATRQQAAEKAGARGAGKDRTLEAKDPGKRVDSNLEADFSYVFAQIPHSCGIAQTHFFRCVGPFPRAHGVLKIQRV
jgi:hypothetical protein